MPADRLSMRKVREVLRLTSTTQLSRRQISRSVGISPTTVGEYQTRLAAAGLSWPLPEDLDDAALAALLFVAPSEQSRTRPLPEWAEIHRELGRRGVTLRLLWQEYKAGEPEGVNYSRFCALYNDWRGGLEVVMRQSHIAGERLFVDYAGMTIAITDQLTGEIHQAQIFVATFGASNYTFCEATATQTLVDWLGSHQRAFAFFGGVPRIIVPDNLKSAVTRAHRYDPEINPSYAELAAHYGVAIIPARARRPRDKAKVENAVQLVEQSILAPLRDRVFASLSEANQAIAELLVGLNTRPLQRLEGSRRSLFEQIDRPALGPLPAQRYEYAEWGKVRAGLDYHITVDGHTYSIPYRYARQQLDVRLSATTLECLLGGERIAVYRRSHQPGTTTVREHMPPSHQQYAAHTPAMITAWAARIGTATATLLERILAEARHPDQGHRLGLGILRLAKAYGEDRLEAAAARALALGTTRYESIVSILKRGLDRQRLAPAEEPPIATPRHENLRGADYYSTDPSTYSRDYPC